MKINVSHRPLAVLVQWRHFTTTTRILQGFVSLFKLGLLLLKPHREYQILTNIKERNEINSGHIVQMAHLQNFGTPVLGERWQNLRTYPVERS